MPASESGVKPTLYKAWHFGFAGAVALGITEAARRCGGIGRRAGFKIQFWRQSVGSTPTTGTNMTIDDPFKKILEQQEALRRAIDPLGDLHQKIKAASDPLARAVAPFANADVINRDLTRIGELGAVSKIADIGRVSRIDTLGLSTLADLNHDHLRLVAGPFADLQRKIGGVGVSNLSNSESALHRNRLLI